MPAIIPLLASLYLLLIYLFLNVARRASKPTRGQAGDAGKELLGKVGNF